MATPARSTLRDRPGELALTSTERRTPAPNTPAKLRLGHPTPNNHTINPLTAPSPSPFPRDTPCTSRSARAPAPLTPAAITPVRPRKAQIRHVAHHPAHAIKQHRVPQLRLQHAEHPPGPPSTESLRSLRPKANERHKEIRSPPGSPRRGRPHPNGASAKRSLPTPPHRPPTSATLSSLK